MGYEEALKELTNYEKMLMDIKDSYINEVRGLIDMSSNRMANSIFDLIYETRNYGNTRMPNDGDLKEKISSIIEEYQNEYYNEMDSYIKYTRDVITRQIDSKMDFTKIANILENITFNEKTPELDSKKIVSRVLTHIGYVNRMNPDYYKVSRNLEELIVKDITKKSTILKEEIDNIYKQTINMVELNKNSYLNNFNKIGTVEREISKNEKSFQTLEPVFTEDTNKKEPILNKDLDSIFGDTKETLEPVFVDEPIKKEIEPVTDIKITQKEYDEAEMNGINYGAWGAYDYYNKNQVMPPIYNLGSVPTLNNTKEEVYAYYYYQAWNEYINTYLNQNNQVITDDIKTR